MWRSKFYTNSKIGKIYKYFVGLSLLLFLLVFLFSLFAQAEKEYITLKKSKSQQIVIPAPTAIVGSISKDVDLMPGNDSYGFFYRADNKKRGVCRIRTKVICDHGLAIVSKIKNREVVLVLANRMFKVRTNHDGEFDLLFRCPKAWHNLSALLNFGKYEHRFKLKNATAEHRIPNGMCK